MSCAWAAVLTVVSVTASLTESRCSPNSYYKNCWMRRFPGVLINLKESERRGAQLLDRYAEESALKCSRTCCLTRNFSCNLAIFHHETTTDAANCLHMHCPALESCVLSRGKSAVLYNIRKGLDPDLLVFGHLRVLPHHYGWNNTSESQASDKRQFIHPPPPPPPSSPPNLSVPSLATPPCLASTTGGLPSNTTSMQDGSVAPTVPTRTAFGRSTLSSPRGHRSTLRSQGNAQTPRTFLRTAEPLTSPQYQTSIFAPVSIKGSHQPPNTTLGSLGRNHTPASEEADHAEGAAEALDQWWSSSVHSLLLPVVVVLVVVITVLLSCCCSILLVVSWQDQRKRRIGYYRRSARGRRGTTHLIKYVIVREN